MNTRGISGCLQARKRSRNPHIDVRTLCEHTHTSSVDDDTN